MGPPGVPGAVAGVFATVQATEFPTRARALADEILVTRPHLIGLQEAVIWRTQNPSAPDPATNVAYDFVQVLLGELTLRGLSYGVAARSTGIDVELPATTAGGFLTNLQCNIHFHSLGLGARACRPQGNVRL